MHKTRTIGVSCCNLRPEVHTSTFYKLLVPVGRKKKKNEADSAA